MANNRFNPSNFDWSWNGSILGVTVSQDRQSGAQSQPNGNFIICEALLGRISEITKSGTLLWSYKNPTGIYFPANGNTTYYNQFSNIPANVNTVFKSEKYPPNFIGFTGKDLTPTTIIENVNSLSAACSQALSVSETNLSNLTLINPVKKDLIQFENSIDLDEVSITDMNGRQVFYEKSFSNNHISIQLESSVYFMKMHKNGFFTTIKIIVE